MSNNPHPDYNEWFSRDTLSLKNLVNIAANQADPDGLPPDIGPWVNIIADLDYHIRLRHLEGVPNPSEIKRHTRVAVEPLWNFLIGPNYIHHSRWDPIREVCVQWAAALDIVLPEPTPLPATQGSASEHPKQPCRKKPAEERHDRWVESAKEMKSLDPGILTSTIASKIRKKDLDFNKLKMKSGDPDKTRVIKDTGTIRRVLTERRNEWELPPES